MTKSEMKTVGKTWGRGEERRGEERRECGEPGREDKEKRESSTVASGLCVLRNLIPE